MIPTASGRETVQGQRANWNQLTLTKSAVVLPVKVRYSDPADVAGNRWPAPSGKRAGLPSAFAELGGDVQRAAGHQDHDDGYPRQRQESIKGLRVRLLQYAGRSGRPAYIASL